MADPLPKWHLLLTGHQFDLQDWVDSLPSGFDPSATFNDDRVLLTAAVLDDAANSQQAFDIGNILLARLNGLMKVVSGSDPLLLDSVAEISADGSLKRHIFATALVRGRAKMRAVGVAIDAQGHIVTPDPKPTLTQELARTALQNDLLADALTYASDCKNWFSLYKAYECIRASAGGDNEILSLGWSIKTEKDRFTRTADSLYRHRKGGKPPPTNPMALDEAADFIGKLIRLSIEQQT